MKRVVLHVGAHRTGSTLLQSLLAELNPQLMEVGVHFDVESSRELAVLSHQADPDISRLRGTLEERCLGLEASTILLSNESLIGDSKNSYSDAPSIARNLREIFTSSEVSVVLYIRRQDLFLESLYHQNIQNGSSEDFETFCDGRDIHGLFWDEIVESYAEIFGPSSITIGVFESLLDNPQQYVSRLFRACGFESEISIGELPLFNPSLSSKGLELARRCNALLTKEEQEKMSAFLVKEFPKDPNDVFDLFSTGERRALLEHYEPSNRRVFEEYLPDHHVERYLA